MLARFEHALEIDKAPVALDEVAVDLGRDFAGLQQARAIDRANPTIGRQPAQGGGVQLVARVVAIASAAHLLDDAVALQRQEQEADHLIPCGTAEGLSLWHIRRQGTLEVAAIPAVGRHEEARAVLRLLRTGIGHDSLRQLAGILKIPHRVLQEARCGLLDYDASWRLSVKLRSLRASGWRSRSRCNSISDRTARMVVAVLRLSTPSVASLARSER